MLASFQDVGGKTACMLSKLPLNTLKKKLYKKVLAKYAAQFLSSKYNIFIRLSKLSFSVCWIRDHNEILTPH